MLLETICLFGVEKWTKVYQKAQIWTFKWPLLAYLLKAKATKQWAWRPPPYETTYQI